MIETTFAKLNGLYGFLDLLVHDPEFWVCIVFLALCLIATAWDIYHNNDEVSYVWGFEHIHVRILESRLNDEAATYSEISDLVSEVFSEMKDHGSKYSLDIEYSISNELKLIDDELEKELPEQAVRLFNELRRLVLKGRLELVERQVITA